MTVADQIGRLFCHHRRHGDDPGDLRLGEQLYNRGVIAGLGIDAMGWDDPQQVGVAFALAKSALTPKIPQHFPWWNAPTPKSED